jgi:hypothetical protein
MSTPTTRPDGAALSAASSVEVPNPQPPSSTRSPGRS